MDANRINALVGKILAEHEGGEKFFDNLDESVRTNADILESIIEVAFDIIAEQSIDTLIVSGNFGRVFSTYYANNYREMYALPIVSVQGGLRKGNEVEEFDCLIENASGRYLFIDDSFYSGATRNKIKDKIESYGGELVNTLVFYDGSIARDESVVSFYRYHA